MDLQALFESVESLNIVDVATSVCGLALTRRGARYECLCPNPYHHDRHLGSFSIRADGNIWGCFACDLGQHSGNAALVAQVKGISKVEAAVEIGLAFGILSQGEAAELVQDWQSRRREPKLYRPLPAPKPKIERRTPEHLDAVYRSFIQAASFPQESQKALMEQRRLDQADMEDFFLLPPKAPAFWASFKSRLAANGLTGTLNDILTGVPGFMRYRKGHRWSFVGKPGCLCLVARSVKDLIVGIQMRRSDSGSGPKYICFSSGSVDDEVFDLYCSSGVLIDVIPPKIGPTSVIAITEGKFKAITLAKQGMWAISVSGVANWRYTAGPVRDVLAQVSDPVVLVFYDADMATNRAVANSEAQLTRMLHSKFNVPIFIASWPLELGKGIDDLVNAGYGDRVRYSEASEYLAHAELPS